MNKLVMAAALLALVSPGGVLLTDAVSVNEDGYVVVADGNVNNPDPADGFGSVGGDGDARTSAVLATGGDDSSPCAYG